MAWCKRTAFWARSMMKSHQNLFRQQQQQRVRVSPLYTKAQDCRSQSNQPVAVCSTSHSASGRHGRAGPPAVAMAPSTASVALPSKPSFPPALSRRSHSLHAAAADCIEAATEPDERSGSSPPLRPDPKTLEEEDDELAASFHISDAMRERNSRLVEELRGELILAPLTRGNHAPFRKFVMDMGCKVTMSEMAFAKTLLKGDKVERIRLKRLPEEACYGFQVATKTISEGLQTASLAHEHGARWMDINCGCPIYEATRRGLGAVMLRKPRALAKMVHGIAKDSELPITVKIRLGESEQKVNVERVVKLLSAAGAAAVIVHGRTMEQRYRRPADWDILQRVAAAPGSVPLVGNGDVLTQFEAERRLQQSGCLAVMVGRGALIKPWIFREFREGRELNPSTAERVSMYRQLYCLMKAHFGDDAMGRRKAWYFAPWHHSFFCRYRHLPRNVYEERSQQYPLLMTRASSVDPLLGEDNVEGLDVVERLLRNENAAAHEAIASALWEATSDADALAALAKLGAEQGPGWEQETKAGTRNGGAEDGDDRG